MTTVANIITKARIKANDSGKTRIKEDTDLVKLLDDHVLSIHDTLVNMRSNLLLKSGTISISSGTETYSPPTGHYITLEDGVYIDEGSPLTKVTQNQNMAEDYSTGGQPTMYYLDDSGDFGFLPVPDGSYTVNVLFFPSYTALAATTDTIPYTFFDRYFELALVVDMLEIMERDNRRYAIFAQQAYDQAMTKVVERGCVRLKFKGMYVN